MKVGRFALVAGLLAAILVGSVSRAGAITFTDGTFNDSDWTVTTLGSGTSSLRRVVSGGNPGAYREITTDLMQTFLWSVHLRAGAEYDPALSGALASIDYSEDARLIDGWGAGQETGPAVRQGGRFYIVYARLHTPDSYWVHKELSGLSENDFVEIDTSRPDGMNSDSHPNFSGSGARLEFGFSRANYYGTYSIRSAIDNWALTATPVPEPPSFAAVVCALCGLGAAVMRRKR